MLNKHRLHFRNNQGFTLLEVMVGLIIFSIGLLGLAGLQSQSLNFNHSASLRSTGTYIAYDIIDRMRNNTDEALTSGYDIALTTDPGAATACNSSTVTCTPAELRDDDLYQWKQAIKNNLPLGQGSVATTKSGNAYLVTVNLQWADQLSSSGTATININSELAPPRF